jgi:hypothetical protein
MRRRKRGRPPKPNARRRETTRAGRRGEAQPDEGTRELRRHRRRATGTTALPADSLGVLFGRGLITTAEYNAARDVGELLATARRGLGLASGGCGSFWMAILSGGRIGGRANGDAATEWALRLLDRLRARIADQLTADLVFAVAGGEIPRAVTTPDGLALLRSGLDCVARCWSAGGQRVGA